LPLDVPVNTDSARCATREARELRSRDDVHSLLSREEAEEGARRRGALPLVGGSRRASVRRRIRELGRSRCAVVQSSSGRLATSRYFPGAKCSPFLRTTSPERVRPTASSGCSGGFGLAAASARCIAAAKSGTRYPAHGRDVDPALTGHGFTGHDHSFGVRSFLARVGTQRSTSPTREARASRRAEGRMFDSGRLGRRHRRSCGTRCTGSRRTHGARSARVPPATLYADASNDFVLVHQE
jgi:hypothetical protein